MRTLLPWARAAAGQDGGGVLEAEGGQGRFKVLPVLSLGGGGATPPARVSRIVGRRVAFGAGEDAAAGGEHFPDCRSCWPGGRFSGRGWTPPPEMPVACAGPGLDWMTSGAPPNGTFCTLWVGEWRWGSLGPCAEGDWPLRGPSPSPLRA